MLDAACDRPPETLLELGSGGGSLAFHLKSRLALTLTDLSPRMLEVSRRANPECEHLQGDMRTLRLGRRFDVVLIHDAVMYLIGEASLRAALATAAIHCRPGGVLLVLPDCVRETLALETECGGEDAPDGRGLRYLEWSWDPDPADDWIETAYAFVLRGSDGSVRAELDRHRCGVFPRDTWRRLLAEAGFEATSRRDPWQREVFVGRRASTPEPPGSV
jgi:SAM-dependent methyltransferase